MSKTSTRVIITGAIALLLCFFLIFILINKNNFPFNFNSKTTNKVAQEQSAFGELSSDKTSTANSKTYLELAFDKNGGELKSKTDGLYIFVLGSSLVDFDHEALWSYDKTPFWAEIKSISSDTSKLDLKFVSPQSMPYLNEQKEVEVIGCEKYNTFLTIENPKSTQTDLDFFSTVKNEDDMIGYCINQECTQVGKLCKIYRY